MLGAESSLTITRYCTNSAPPVRSDDVATAATRARTQRRAGHHCVSCRCRNLSAACRHSPHLTYPPPAACRYLHRPQEFRPRLTPRQVIRAGTWGGCYFHPRGGKPGIKHPKGIDIDHKEFPAEWFAGLPEGCAQGLSPDL